MCREPLSIVRASVSPLSLINGCLGWAGAPLRMESSVARQTGPYLWAVQDGQPWGRRPSAAIGTEGTIPVPPQLLGRLTSSAFVASLTCWED